MLRPIGRGAYGEVWLARNVMGVMRAVKIVERQQFDSNRPYEREFAGIQRYEPVSRLADGLVHVLHVGRNDEAGYFYYVMELADDAGDRAGVNGLAAPANARSELGSADNLMLETATYQPRTLRSDLQQRHRLPTVECVRVAMDLVSGLAKLHEQGLVHRDVKPGNIIFVNRRAKLADIGLVATGSEGRTFVGTEGYIPPEGPGLPVADIYALGMALYEAATGYAPERFPKVPAEWFAEEAGREAIEFHEIVLKACEGDKDRRYQSAEQMQADLALLHSGQSVRHMRMLEKRAAWMQRLAATTAIVLTIAVATTLLANWKARIAERTRQRESRLLHEAQNARAKESEARARAEEAENDARRQLNAALFEQARALTLSKELGHRTRALEALRRAAGATNAAGLRRVAFAALALPDLRLDGEIRFDPALTLLQVDPAFQRVALCRGGGPVTIHSLPGLELLSTLPATTNRDAYVALWSANGHYLTVKRQRDFSGGRSSWEVWDVGRTQCVVVTSSDVAHGAASLHPQQPLFMAGHGRGRVTEWNLETRRPVRAFKLPDTPHSLAYSPDGTRIAASYRVGTNWTVAIHDAANPESARFISYPESIAQLSWHPQGQWVCGIGGSATAWARGVHLIDVSSGTVTTIGEHKIKTARTEFTADGEYLVTGGWDREIVWWNLRTQERAFTYAGPGYKHSWSSDGRRCAVILPENVVQFFEFEQPSYRSLAGTPGHAVRMGRFSPDGRWLVAQDSQQLWIWDVTQDGPPALVRMPLRTAPLFSADSSEMFGVADQAPDGGYLLRWRLLAATNSSSPPRVETLVARSPKGLIRAAPASHELVMTSEEGVRFVAITNIDSSDGRTVRESPGVSYVSPDARWLAMLSDYSPVVRVYHLPDMQQVAALQTSNMVGFITFSPRCDEMLVLNRSGVEWFDTATWQCTRRQPGAPVSGSYAFYTPDGHGIWMVTHFRNAALLDRRTLEPLLPLPNDVVPLALSPDGRQLAVSVAGRRVQLWDMAALRDELARLQLDW